MLTLIPAIDVIDGKCVRLSKGDFNRKKIYNEDPLEVARAYEDHGLTRLHLVDLDGAKSKHVVNWRILEKIASKTNLIIDFGGGIKSDQDLYIVYNSGAQLATIGSIAVSKREMFFKWLNENGADKIILGADVSDRKIAVSGWKEITDIDLIEFLDDYLAKGVTNILCTDISKDGMLEGTSIDLYRELVDKYNEMKLIASGGVTSIDELYRLEEMGVHGAIIGKAIYEKRISLNDLKAFTLR
jgi:phosphoribosylformimino-5-aminoimidazole carboxamide ribotide isomerase